MEFLCGEENQIFKHLINKDIFEVVLSIVAVLGGMIFVIFGLYNWRKKTLTEELLMIGSFSVIMGFSRLSDIRLMQFLWNKRPTFNFYLSVLMLVVGMYPILTLMKKRLNQINKLILNMGTIIVSVVAGGVILLQIFNIRDFRECLWVIHVLIGFVVALILGCYIYDMCCKKKEQRKFDIVRMPYICVIGALIDVIVFYIRGTSSSLIFSLMSFLIYIFMRGIQLMIEHMNYRSRMQEQEVKLAEERMFIMLSQIQPHFIFNVLGSIYHLCDQNPTLAKEAIDQFSTYLRGNLEALSKKNLVSFEEEFKHVSIYLALEKMRFADELDIKYDIQAKDFFVPALSIQPLVENAVKHGIGAKIEGGSVTIATLDLVKYYEIRISDDGIGFDPEKPMNDGRTHVGISNVRSRLESMCNGTLEIQSEPGKGTVSIIRVPKESEEIVS
jgi:signal transduction histidine kinase